MSNRIQRPTVNWPTKEEISKCAYVAFGDKLCKLIEKRSWVDVHKNMHSDLHMRRFKTIEERRAYITGLMDSCGYDDYYILDELEVRALSNYTDLKRLERKSWV